MVCSWGCFPLQLSSTNRCVDKSTTSPWFLLELFLKVRNPGREARSCMREEGAKDSLDPVLRECQGIDLDTRFSCKLCLDLTRLPVLHALLPHVLEVSKPRRSAMNRSDSTETKEPPHDFGVRSVHSGFKFGVRSCYRTSHCPPKNATLLAHPGSRLCSPLMMMKLTPAKSDLLVAGQGHKKCPKGQRTTSVTEETKPTPPNKPHL